MTDTSGYRRRTRHARSSPSNRLRPEAEHAADSGFYGPRARGDAMREQDDTDREINRSLETGEPIDLERAYPEPAPDPKATPADRLRKLKRAHPEYYRLYRQKLVHRMILRGIPMDVVAGQLQVSLDAIRNDYKHLKKRLRHEASNMDANTIIGDTRAFYAEVRANAMRNAVNPQLTANEQARQFMVALKAQEDEHRFLVTCGFWRSVQWKPKGGEEKNEADALKRLTHALVQGDSDTVDNAIAELAGEDEDDDDDDFGFID